MIKKNLNEVLFFKHQKLNSNWNPRQKRSNHLVAKHFLFPCPLTLTHKVNGLEEWQDSFELENSVIQGHHPGPSHQEKPLLI